MNEDPVLMFLKQSSLSVVPLKYMDSVEIHGLEANLDGGYLYVSVVV